MLKRGIVCLVSMLLAISFCLSASLTLDGAVQYQTIEGLGGAMESHAIYENNSQFWDMVFNDLGVSAINLGPPEDPYSEIGGPFWMEEIRPIALQAKAHGVSTFVTIPNPKPEWKIGPNGEPGILAGGTLRSDCYSNYSYYMLSQLSWIKSKTGIDIDYILPAPEPNWLYWYDPSGVWPFFYMTQADYTAFLKVMGPIFRDSGINVRISAPCGNSVPVTIQYASTILADPVARQYVDGIVTNGYEYSTNAASWQQLANLAQQYGKTHTWVAEVSHFDVPNQMPAADAAGIFTARWLHEALVNGSVSHYYWIQMIDKGNFSKDVRGFVYSKDWPCKNGNCQFPTDGITKQGYAFKQFAHWVRPGAVRVKTTSDDNKVLASGFLHQTDRKIIMVIINNDTTSKTVQFSFSSVPGIATLDVYRTSASQNSTYLGQATVIGNALSYTLPAMSITTFYGGYTPQASCQSAGYVCCSSCASGPHSQYDSSCNQQVCCDSCAQSGQKMILTSTADTWIQDENGGSRDSNLGSNSLMAVGGRWQTTFFRSIVRFDMAQIPTGVQVSDAKLRLYHSSNSVEGSNVNTIGVYKVLRDWQESGATWNNYRSGSAWSSPGAGAIGADRDGTLLSSRSFDSAAQLNRYYDFNVTSAVQNHLAGSTFYGFILIGKEYPSADRYFNGFATKESANQPLLEITYFQQTCTTIEELQTYISQWRYGSISLGTLMQRIAQWKQGCQ